MEERGGRIVLQKHIRFILVLPFLPFVVVAGLVGYALCYISESRRRRLK